MDTPFRTYGEQYESADVVSTTNVISDINTDIKDTVPIVLPETAIRQDTCFLSEICMTRSSLVELTKIVEQQRIVIESLKKSVKDNTYYINDTRYTLDNVQDSIKVLSKDIKNVEASMQDRYASIDETIAWHYESSNNVHDEY